MNTILVSRGMLLCLLKGDSACTYGLLKSISRKMCNSKLILAAHDLNSKFDITLEKEKHQMNE